MPASGAAPALYAGLLPYDDVEGGRARILGRMAAFAETLFQLAERLARPQTLPHWADCLRDLIERLFIPRKKSWPPCRRRATP